MGVLIRAAAKAVMGAIRAAVKEIRAVLSIVRKHGRKAEHHAKSMGQAARRIVPPKIGIRVDGLKEFRRELRKLASDGTWTSALRDVNREVAQEALREVQALARSQPRVIGKRRRPERGHWSDYVGNFRVVASQTSAGVRLGTTTRRGGWYLGSNFGSIGKKQFPPQGSPDHALYKGIERAMPRVVDAYGRELDRLAKRAFPD
jgi:hypothetical protein